MIEIIPLPAFTDNYIWLIQNTNDRHCVVVDPGDGNVVADYLLKHDKVLSAALITHHHKDHTGGLATLKQQWPNLRIIGPAAESEKIALLTEPVTDNQQVAIPELAMTFDILAIPGHTQGHIAFYSAPVLFCGDTLFSAGCGRLLEGSYAESALQMHNSLRRLSCLPDNTLVYCTHEYTLANIRFARHIEPNNQALLRYEQVSQEKRQQAKPTLPTTIKLEKSVNPFLRCENMDLQTSLNQNSSLTLFTYLREAKDQFKS